MARRARHSSICTRQGRHSKFANMQSTQKQHVTECQIHGDTIIGELLLLAGPTVVGG